MQIEVFRVFRGNQSLRVFRSLRLHRAATFASTLCPAPSEAKADRFSGVKLVRLFERTG